MDRLKWYTLPAILTWMVIPSLLQIGYVCSPRIHVEVLTPIVIVLKSETSGCGLGHESVILMNRISVVIKRDPREALPSSVACEDTIRKWWSTTAKRVFTRT